MQDWGLGLQGYNHVGSMCVCVHSVIMLVPCVSVFYNHIGSVCVLYNHIGWQCVAVCYNHMGSGYVFAL